jgi:hypothetical protein
LEAETNLTLQNALVMSKVVRIDYPLDWPDVLTNLVRVLRTVNYSNQQHPRRGMLITQQIIKELSTTRLRISQTHLQSVTSGIDVAMLMPRYISQRRGATIFSILGILAQPRRFLTQITTFIAVLSSFGVFIGPAATILIVDFGLSGKPSGLFPSSTSQVEYTGSLGD